MNIRSLTRGDGAVIGAAVLLLIASFLPFFSFSTGIGSDKSVSSWSPALFPLLPTVTLAALVSAGLFVYARTQPGAGDRQLVGLTLQQWGIALAVFVGWAALWSAFSNIVPSAAGSNSGVSKGAGAWLTLVFGLAFAAAGVLANRLPALKAPLLGAPQQPQQYGIGAPGGAQPYAAGPPQAAYGYPGGPQSVETPFGQGQSGPGQHQPYGAQAPQPPAAPQGQSSEFTAFWFAVPVPRPLFAEDGSGSQISELTPGTWYLAVEQRGSVLIAQTQDGRRGLLQDSSGIQRG